MSSWIKLLSALILLCWSAQATAQEITTAPNRLGNKTVALDQDGLLVKQLGRSRIINKGSVAQLGVKEISQVDRKVKLKALTDELFEEQVQLKRQLTSVSGAVYGPIIEEDEAYETPDGFLVMRTTRMTIKDASLASQRSALYKRNFGANKGSIRLSALKPAQKQLLDRIKATELAKLPADHPLKQAAQRGDQAILDALTSGVGELEVTDTAFISKTPVLISGGKMKVPKVVNGALDYSSMSVVDVYAPTPTDRAIAPNGQITTLPPSRTASGAAPFKAEFINGWTIGYDMNWERKWKRKYLGFFRLTLRAYAGVGLRVPIEVSGQLQPSLIQRTGPTDQEDAYKVQIKARTLDANKDFYKRAGMPNHHLFEGKEAFMTMGYGYGYKLHVLGIDVLHKPYSEKSIGPQFDFAAPMSSSWKTVASYFIPASLTNTSFNFGALKGSARFGVKLESRGKIVVKYLGKIWTSAQNILAISGTSADSAGMPLNPSASHIEVTLQDPNQPKTVYSKINKRGTPGVSQYGFEVGQLQYQADFALTPGVDLDFSVGYDSWSLDIGYTLWLDMFRVRMLQIKLGPHDNTKQRYEFRPGTKQWRRDSPRGDQA